MHIRPDPLTDPSVIAILERHMELMLASSPPGACHFLDLGGLRAEDVTFWSIWNDEDEVVGCGALKQIDDQHGELKSMHVLAEKRGAGTASILLTHILNHAKSIGLNRISLETGCAEGFRPAIQLYEKFGFRQAAPFGDYIDNGFSYFMTKKL